MVIKNNKIQRKIFFLLLLFWLITSDAFNSPMLRVLGGFYGKPLNTLLMVCLLGVLFVKRKNINIGKCHFSRFILAFIVLPFTASITSYIYQGQDFFLSLQSAFLSYTSILVVYYVLHAYDVSERTIIKAIIVLGVFLSLILIVQQIFPGSAYFGVQTSEGNLSGYDMEVRNGLYRFRIRGTALVMLSAFYYWSLSLKKISLNNGILFCILFVGIYLFLTRQILFGSILAVFLSFFGIMERLINGLDI